jgi:hypothetical protein
MLKPVILTDGRCKTRLADLVEPADGTVVPEPEWTRLRGSRLIDNLLAAIAEKLAANVGIRAAAWTALVEPLDTPWEAPGTPRRRAATAAQTAPEFAARNITLSTSAIWRDRAMAGA